MEERLLTRRQLLRLRRQWRKNLGWRELCDWICFVEAIPTDRLAASWLLRWERLLKRLDLSYTGAAYPEHLDGTVAGRGEWRAMYAKVNSLKSWLAKTSADWIVSDFFDAVLLKGEPGEDAGARIKDHIRWRGLKR